MKTLTTVQRYRIQGTYALRSKAGDPVTFEDSVEAKSAEQAFVLWERKHSEKPLLRFESIEPLF